MPHHTIAINERRYCWAPTLFKPCLEHLIRIWHVVPYDDRRYRAQSCGTEDQSVISPRHNRIVREFVLNDDARDNRRLDRAGWLTPAPAKHVGQGFQPTELAPWRVDFRR
jgi:hypothetical protein